MVKKKLFIFLLGAFLSISQQSFAASDDSWPSVTKDAAYMVGGSLAGGVVGFSIGYCFSDSSPGMAIVPVYWAGFGLLIGAAIGAYKAHSSYAPRKTVIANRTIFNTELL